MANISEMDQDIPNWTHTFLTAIPFVLGADSLVNFGQVTSDISRSRQVLPTEMIFGKSYFVPKRCCAPKFWHTLENDQALLAHTPQGSVVPLTIFYNGGLKLA